MMMIAVIVPFYGGSQYIQRLLSSIPAEANGCTYQIYIVDNSKKADRLDLALVNHPNVELILAQEGLGFGKACNIGFKLCLKQGADFVAIVNQDGYFKDGSLPLLVERLVGEPSFSVAVPLLTEYESEMVEEFFTHVYLTPMTVLVSDLFRNDVKPFYKMDDLCGACFVMKIRDYPFPYLFDELYQMYFEDADLFRRLQRSKRNVMFVPSAVFHHVHSNTKGEFQTIRSLTVKTTSKHIFDIKNSRHGLVRALYGWSLLRFRNILQAILQFRLNVLLVEVSSSFYVLPKLIQINNRRKAENAVSSAQ